MAVSRWRADSATEARLGSQVLADLGVNLWPVDCQSCGEPLRRWSKPSLEVQAEDGFAAASLHHRRCRPPEWVDGELDARDRRHLTWQAGCFLLPPGNVPIFLVNPSYEYAFLRESDDGQWRIATLEMFTALGFALEFPSEPGPLLPSLSASLDRGRISVDVRHDDSVLHAWHGVPIPADISAVVHGWGDIMVAVTTLMDVRKPFTIEQIQLLLATGRVALGRARLTSAAFDAQSQRLRPGELNSDLQAEAFAIALEAVRRTSDAEFGRAVIGAALALCDGNDWLIRQLTPREKMAAVLMVSGLFALDARDKSGEAARGRGVHVITSDSASADEHLEFFRAAADEGGLGSVGRLGPDPLSAEGSETYLSDIVIGTKDEFIVAHNAYSGAGPDWDLHASRGRLALVSGSDLVGTELIRHYLKVATV